MVSCAFKILSHRNFKSTSETNFLPTRANKHPQFLFRVILSAKDQTTWLNHSFFLTSRNKLNNRRRSVRFASSPSVVWTWINCWTCTLSSSWSWSTAGPGGGSPGASRGNLWHWWSVWGRPRRRPRQWKNQKWSKLTWGTWSSCPRWSAVLWGFTTARPSIRSRSRWGQLSCSDNNQNTVVLRVQSLSKRIERRTS